MKSKKILFILFILMQISTISFADNYYEDLDKNLDYYISVSSNISDTPSINARHAIIFDRASKTTLYGKSENEIAEQLKINQSVVNQHSTTFGWNAVEQLLKYYEQMEF